MPKPVGAGRVPRVHRTMMIGAPGDWRWSSSLLSQEIFDPNRTSRKHSEIRRGSWSRPCSQSVKSSRSPRPPTQRTAPRRALLGPSLSSSYYINNRQPSEPGINLGILLQAAHRLLRHQHRTDRDVALRALDRDRPFDGLSVLSAADFPHSRRPQCADDCFPLSHRPTADSRRYGCFLKIWIHAPGIATRLPRPPRPPRLGVC